MVTMLRKISGRADDYLKNALYRHTLYFKVLLNTFAFRGFFLNPKT